MQQKAIAIGAKHKRYAQRFCIVKRLLYTCAYAMFIVLGFNDGERSIGFVIQDIIGTLLLTTGMQLPSMGLLFSALASRTINRTANPDE